MDFPPSSLVLDASVVVALVRNKPNAAKIRALLEAATELYIGAPTLLEVELAVRTHIPEAIFRDWWPRLNVTTLPFTDAHVMIASDAFARYGKGQHAAGLNFGDCMSYATAKQARLPLLYQGEDFAQTDLDAIRVI